MACIPENKYPPKPCPCPEIPGPVGPQGPIGIQGPQGEDGEAGVAGAASYVESGSFDKNSSSAITTVTTVRQAKLIFFTVSSNTAGSIGTDDGVNASCLSTNPVGASSGDLLNSIDVAVLANGMTAKVTFIAATSFSITFVATGIGLNLTVQWKAITG